MNKQLQHIINVLSASGKDYSNFKALLAAIKASGIEFSKDDILDFVASDYRIQLHITHNNIAKLIAHLAKESNSQNAIDICCGTGNILYYLQNEIDNLTGVEIVDNVAELTKYFIPDLKIITADTLIYPFAGNFDLVVGNIPWGMKVSYSGKLIPIEEAFIRKAFDLINNNGEVILLVPNSILVSLNFQKLRNDFNSYLKEIISLPEGQIRNSLEKTTLLVFNRNKSDTIIISKLSQFDNLVEEYLYVKKNEIPKKNLINRWDPEYHLLKENNFYKELDEIKTVQLNELAEVLNGKSIIADKLHEKGDFLYLKPLHIKDGSLSSEKSLKYIIKDDIKEGDFKCILQAGDIIISTIFNDLKMYVYKKEDIPAFASNNLAIIRSSKQDYILSYLQTEEGRRIFKTQAIDLRKGATIPHITLKDIQTIRIPVLPISDLNSLGNTSIQKSTKNELLNQLELLKSINPESINTANEPMAIYSNSLGNQADIILNFLNDRFNRIESQLNIVNKKLDKLLELIKELKNDFDTIKAIPRDDEEKLFKLCQKIDSKLDVIYSEEKNTIEGYIEEIKRWLDLWELLDLQSQKFLPIAEFIFDELSKLEDADYAPFVLQYCRTLENEILKKLFETYHNIGIKSVDIDELVKLDLVNQKTSKFAQMVKRNKITYTLGDMNFIMALLKQGGNTLNESPLLQHFRLFTILYFDEKIVEAEFLKDVNKLTNDYRNKAAHPYTIGIDLAKECQMLLRKSLNVFLESLKNNINDKTRKNVNIK